MKPADFDRLLRSAAKAPEGPAPETPFGFETRVLAAWRSRHEGFNDVADLTRFLRRTGVIAFVVLTIASAAAYKQFTDSATLTAPQTNEYAIGDSQIQTEFSE
jgi:hypothetical protein